MKNIFGYFDSPSQAVPVSDPGLDVDCPICGKPLRGPVNERVVTTSLMADGDSRSYFYRLHRSCYEGAAAEIMSNIDSLVIDSIATLAKTSDLN